MRYDPAHTHTLGNITWYDNFTCTIYENLTQLSNSDVLIGTGSLDIPANAVQPSFLVVSEQGDFSSNCIIPVEMNNIIAKPMNQHDNFIGLEVFSHKIKRKQISIIVIIQTKTI